jgi:hypothetical protein
MVNTGIVMAWERGYGQLRKAAGECLLGGSRLRRCSLASHGNARVTFDSGAPRLTSEVIDLPT